jgi:hypothetical protein
MNIVEMLWVVRVMVADHCVQLFFSRAIELMENEQFEIGYSGKLPW